MEETTENVCRLCLSTEGAFFLIDISVTEMLQLITHNVNVNVSKTRNVVCEKCRKTLEIYSSFKKKFYQSDSLVQKRINELKILNKINLKQIIVSSRGEDGERKNVCRTCLKVIEGKFLNIDKGCDPQIQDILEACVLDLNINLTLNPVICEVCYDILEKTSQKKKVWASVETKIENYLKLKKTESVDLKELVEEKSAEDLTKNDDFLNLFEVQDEEGPDLLDNETAAKQEPKEKKTNMTNNKKRSAEDETPPLESVAKKTANNDTADEEPSSPEHLQKSSGTEMKSEPSSSEPPVTKSPDPVKKGELPDIEVNPYMMYRRDRLGVMKNWMVEVEKIKAENDWSDEMAQNKVLMKLKSLGELYTWFKNVADVMKWDEWKRKLLLAFPPEDDFYINMRDIVRRRKKPTETFEQYYNAKLSLLAAGKIGGSQAISCLIGGIPDVQISSRARIGDFKTPEELLIYFRSCDSKAQMEYEQKSASYKKMFEKSPAPACLSINTKDPTKTFNTPAKKFTASPKTNEAKAKSFSDSPQAKKMAFKQKSQHFVNKLSFNLKGLPSGKKQSNNLASSKYSYSTPDRKEKNKKFQQCFYCMQFGHVKHQCYKWKADGKREGSGSKPGNAWQNKSSSNIWMNNGKSYGTF